MRPWPLRASFGLTSIRLSCGRTFAVLRQETEPIGSIGVFFGLDNEDEVVVCNKFLRVRTATYTLFVFLRRKPFGSFCDSAITARWQCSSHFAVLPVVALLTRATAECWCLLNCTSRT